MISGHSLKFKWVKRRSQSVTSVGDEIQILWDPPLPSGTTEGKTGQIVMVMPYVVGRFPEQEPDIAEYYEINPMEVRG